MNEEDVKRIKILHIGLPKTPDWATHIAVDLDGSIYAFDTRPHRRNCDWGPTLNCDHVGFFPGDYPDWKNSLIKL